MKSLWLTAALLSFLPWAISSRAQSSGPFDVTWFTIDGGGGTGTGGSYAVSGTIGQSDAGTMTGGVYTLQGGFWSGFIQTEVGPPLSIRLEVPGQVTIAWPNPSTDFALQQSTAFLGAGTSWSSVASEPTVVGNEKQVTLPLNPGIRFFRLGHP